MNLDDFKKLFEGKKVIVFHKKQVSLQSRRPVRDRTVEAQSARIYRLFGMRSQFFSVQFSLEEVSYPERQLSYLQSVDAIALQGVKSIHHFVGALTSTDNLKFVELSEGPLDEKQEKEIKSAMESNSGFAAILVGSGNFDYSVLLGAHLLTALSCVSRRVLRQAHTELYSRPSSKPPRCRRRCSQTSLCFEAR